MNIVMKSMIATMLLLACSGCGQNPFAPPDKQAAAKPAPAATTTASAFSLDGADCNSLATKRMALYDRPDTYPISDQQRKDAMLALYSACMREHNYQIAGPIPTSAADNSQLANLSPAAGGNMQPRTNANIINAGNTTVSSTSVPGATVVVIGGNGQMTPQQLASIAPAAGGVNSASAQPTVVMVQNPQNNVVAVPVTPYRAAAAPLPVAVPLAPPPVARAYAPSPYANNAKTSAAIAPRQTAGVAAQTEIRRAPAQNPTLQPAALPAANTSNNAPVPGGMYNGTYNNPPSLASASDSLAGTSPHAASQIAANKQLENVIDQ